jgi:hypothetical protein
MLNRTPEAAMPELYLLTRDLPNFALFAISCHESEPDPAPRGGHDDEPLQHDPDRPPEYLERRQPQREPLSPGGPSLAVPQPAPPPRRPALAEIEPQDEHAESPAPALASPPPLDISRPVVRLRGEQTGPRNEYARTTGPPRRLSVNLADWRLIQIGGAIVVILLIVAFVPSLLREGRNERIADLLDAAQVQFAAAQQQTDPAQRRFLLEETRRLAAEALRNDELNLTANQLHQQSEALLAEMNAVFDLGPLTSLATLSNQLTGEISLLDATVHGGNVYLLDEGGARIVAVPLDGSPSHVIYEEGGQYGEAQAKAPAFFTWQGPDDSGRLLVLDAERKLFEVRPGSAPAPVALRQTGTWTSVAGIAAFDENLYVLDPEGNQVHRYLPAADGYDSEPDPVLAGQIELQDAIALAVDGDIFIALADGSVRRFRNGEDAGFSLGGIDVPIEAANDIEALPSAQELYISDSAAKRIVVAGHDGAFRRQLVSGAFTDLRAIAIDTAASQLYVVIGDELLTAPLVR